MANVRDGQMRSTVRRAHGGTREIMKRRPNPLKTIKTVVTGPKKKMRAHASFHGRRPNPPSGYSFLPFGTAELAWRCKALANDQGVQILYVTSSKKLDPRMISHHTNRVGYYFPTTILSRACAELDYTQWSGKYMKASEALALQTKDQTAAILRRYGVPIESLALDPESQETAPESMDQVKALFKELFPAMPDETMNVIIAHSWQPGTTRVGTNYSLPLAKRIQSATVAHVRHMYTDYDALLAAFGERDEARAEVHKTILDKTVEWLGHQAEEEDVLEDIVRDFIVVDSDEESGSADDASDDEEGATESDSSVQFHHHVAAGAEDVIEETDESARVWQQKLAERTAQAQALIAEQRQRAYHNPNTDMSGHSRPPTWYPDVAAPARVNVAYRDADVIVIGGKEYRREPMSTAPSHTQGRVGAASNMDARDVVMRPSLSTRWPYDATREMTVSDRPVRSIEAGEPHTAPPPRASMTENIWPGAHRRTALPQYKILHESYEAPAYPAGDGRPWSAAPQARDSVSWQPHYLTAQPSAAHYRYQPGWAVTASPSMSEAGGPPVRYLPPQHGAPAPIQQLQRRPDNQYRLSHTQQYRPG